MTDKGSAVPSAGGGFVAYDRDTVDRFFAYAHDERNRLRSAIDRTRRRIALAEASLAASSGAEHASIHTVLDAQRRLREEWRANERAITAIYADAEAEAEKILLEAHRR